MPETPSARVNFPIYFHVLIPQSIRARTPPSCPESCFFFLEKFRESLTLKNISQLLRILERAHGWTPSDPGPQPFVGAPRAHAKLNKNIGVRTFQTQPGLMDPTRQHGFQNKTNQYLFFQKMITIHFFLQD